MTQVCMLGHSIISGSGEASSPNSSRRRLLGTSEYNEACANTSYPKDDALFGRGVFNCDQLDNGALVLFALGVLYMFFALAIVCDEYFVPALEALVERWDIDDDVAGATFMAAGGSAPELFTSLIGSFTESSVGFGTIVGSAVFNVLFVIGVCAMASAKTLELEWWPLFRDCAYYAFGLIVLSVFFGFVSPNRIEVWESIILLLMYFGYVVMMKYHLDLHRAICRTLGLEYKEPRHYEFLQHGIMNLLQDKLQLNVEVHMVMGLGGSQVSKFEKLDQSKDGRIDADELHAELMKDPIFAQNPTSKEVLRAMLTQADTNGDGYLDRDEFRKWYEGARKKIDQAVEALFKELDLNSDGRIDKSEAAKLMLKVNPKLSDAEVTSIWNKLDKVSDGGQGEKSVPGTPQDAEDKGFKYKTGSADQDNSYINMAIFSQWYQRFVLQTEKKGSFKNAPAQPEAEEEGGDDGDDDDDKGFPDTLRGQIMYCINYPIIFTLQYTLPDCTKEEGKKWAGCGFIGSIVWIGVYAYFMVWWATVVGDVLGIPVEVMGLTFLAAGTSVPDLLSSVIVAQRGKGDMAVSSSVGSNIFDILFGLPFPWLLYTLFYGITENDFRDNLVSASSLITDVLILLAMVLYVIGSVMAAGWKMSKNLGISYFVMYGVFVLQKLIRVYAFGEKDR
eukprot:CAMPEP_0114246072 /NCGR_PEP_ID=MMETSP0058-20121206/12252_1 /TAXON_ID=36894 /ORGANISM="Pyramimonas parkeae, CCMP726" /LENGTH=672 /DNA_ID=CAMNT_0001359203 /DNA_START=293 /DNA_END=2314 /DNA_ORIENTATION=+